jgi:hypothetical protein
MIDRLTDAPDGSIREADSERPAAGVLLQLKRIHWRAMVVSAAASFARANGRAAHYACARVLFERLAAHLAAHLDSTGCAKEATLSQRAAARGAVLDLLVSVHAGLRSAFAHGQRHASVRSSHEMVFQEKGEKCITDEPAQRLLAIHDLRRGCENFLLRNRQGVDQADGLKNLFIGMLYRRLLREQFGALNYVALPYRGVTLPIDTLP